MSQYLSHTLSPLQVGVSAGTLSLPALSAFLRGAGSLDIATARKKPAVWMPDAAWLSVVALGSLPIFGGLPDSVARSDALWRAWYDLEAPELGKIPDLEGRLSRFERMMVLRALRPDRTLVAAVDYISEALGPRFVESVPVNLEATWAQSTNRVPLICLLSPGADPTRMIEELAKRKKIKLLGVSMGQARAGSGVERTRGADFPASPVSSHPSRRGRRSLRASSWPPLRWTASGCCCRTRTWGWATWRRLSRTFSSWKRCTRTSGCGSRRSHTRPSPSACCRWASKSPTRRPSACGPACARRTRG